MDSPSGRVARAQEVDAAWQQLWREEYTRHTPARFRGAFEEDYRAWQRVKESIGGMSNLALMLPATGEILDRWTTKARDWAARFAEEGIPTTAPTIRAPEERSNVTRLVWGVAAATGALALVYALSKLPKLKGAPAY